MIHPQEALLQEARALQQSEAFAPYRKLRQAAEHRLARLMQLGVRQARYFVRRALQKLENITHSKTDHSDDAGWLSRLVLSGLQEVASDDGAMWGSRSAKLRG
jgi:hypothetical protein